MTIDRLHIQLALLSLALSIAAAPAAWAQQPTGDPARGLAVAKKVCVSCHAIEPGDQTRQADVPSFQEIANRPGRTSEVIVGAMSAPHPVMPGAPLTLREMRDVAAYILAFRKTE